MNYFEKNKILNSQERKKEKYQGLKFSKYFVYPFRDK